MITAPVIVYPNNNTIDDNNVISGDAKGNNFFMEIRTSGETVNAYQTEIFKSLDSSKVYDSKKTSTKVYNGESLNFLVPSGFAKNGEDYYWKATLYSDNADMLVASGVTQEEYNGSAITIKIRQHISIEPNMILKIGTYKRKIISYDYETGIAQIDSAFPIIKKGSSYTVLSNFIHTPEYFFKARATPSIDFKDLPSVISSRTQNFIGTYTSPGGASIKYHIFNLYDNQENLIASTGKVYSSLLEYEFDGFISNRDYFLELIVMNQDNQDSYKREKLHVQYRASGSERAYCKTKFLENKNAIEIDWAKANQSIGRIEPYSELQFKKDFPFQGTNSVILPSGSSIVFDTVNNEKMEFDDSATLIMSTQIENDKQGEIIKIFFNDNSFSSITLEGYTFYFKNSERTSRIIDIVPIKDCFQEQNIVEDEVGYFLYENRLWDDNKFFIVQNVIHFDKKQYRIILQKDYGNVKELE